MKRQEEELREERAYLQALANRQHNARIPIARLPEEVLQAILILDHSELVTRDIPVRNIRLMAVSHAWLVTVTNLAHLWTSFAVGQGGILWSLGEHKRNIISRVRTFIARSKEAPLYLQIFMNMNDVVDMHLRDYLRRVRDLEVNAFSPSQKDVEPLPHSRQLKSLQNLKLAVHKRQTIGTCIPMLPDLEQSGCRLRRLTLLNCEYDAYSWQKMLSPSTYCSSLISLVIHSSLEPVAFAIMLMRCPQLQYVTYTMDATMVLQTSTFTPPYPYIMLPHLESLIITGEKDVIRCLACLGAPNLVHLEIQRSYNSPRGTPTELPLWLAPSGELVRFPNLRSMTNVYLA